MLPLNKKIIGRRYLREASDIDCILEYTGEDCMYRIYVDINTINTIQSKNE